MANPSWPRLSWQTVAALPFLSYCLTLPVWSCRKCCSCCFSFPYIGGYLVQEHLQSRAGRHHAPWTPGQAFSRALGVGWKAIRAPKGWIRVLRKTRDSRTAPGGFAHQRFAHLGPIRAPKKRWLAHQADRFAQQNSCLAHQHYETRAQGLGRRARRRLARNGPEVSLGMQPRSPGSVCQLRELRL